MLLAVSTDVLWPPQAVMEDPRSLNTGYGYMAFKSRVIAEREVYGSVLGTVELWGHIVEHELGYRAVFARVRTLERFAEHVHNRAELRRLYTYHGEH